MTTMKRGTIIQRDEDTVDISDVLCTNRSRRTYTEDLEGEVTLLLECRALPFVILKTIKPPKFNLISCRRQWVTAKNRIRIQL